MKVVQWVNELQSLPSFLHSCLKYIYSIEVELSEVSNLQVHDNLSSDIKPGKKAG